MNSTRFLICIVAGTCACPVFAAPTRADLDWAAGYAKAVVRYCPAWRLRDTPALRRRYTDAKAARLNQTSPALLAGVAAVERARTYPAFCARPLRGSPQRVALIRPLLRAATPDEGERSIATGANTSR